jgi:hypothetical protein
VRLQATGQGCQSGTRDPGGALGGDDHEDEQGDLLSERERLVQGLGDEQGRHGQVDRGPVEVERVARRHRDAHDRTRDAEVLHLRDQAGQRRLRGRGRQDEEELAREVPEQGEDAHARHQAQDRTQDDEHEQCAGRVERQHDQPEGLERVDAGRADDGRHGAEGPDRRHPHDHRHDLEDQALDVLDANEDRLAHRPHHLDREPREQRHDQRLQDLAGSEGAEQRVGDESQQEVRGGRVLPSGRLLARRGSRGGEVQAGTRLDDVADHEADAEGDRGHREEVAQREASDLAHLGGLSHGTDAEDDGAEDDRADHHLDQVDEAGSDRLELHRHVGCDEADDDAGEDRDDDGEVEVVRSVATRCAAVDSCVGAGAHDDSWGCGPGVDRAAGSSESGGCRD